MEKNNQLNQTSAPSKAAINESVIQTPVSQNTLAKRPFPKLLILIIILLILILGSGGYFFLNAKSQYLTVSKTQSSIPTPAIKSSPTPMDEIGLRKTYRNEEFNFEVKYPSAPEWNVKVSENTDSILSAIFFSPNKIEFTKQSEGPMTPISITIWKGELNNIISSTEGTNAPLKEGFLNTLTTKVTEGTYGEDSLSPNTKYKRVYFEKNGYVYSIAYLALNEFSLEDFNKFISTFKFIEIDEKTGWKIYDNKEYGFSFKYPSDFRVNDISPLDKSLYVYKIGTDHSNSFDGGFEWPRLIIDREAPNPNRDPAGYEKYGKVKESSLFNEVYDEITGENMVYKSSGSKKVYFNCYLYKTKEDIKICDSILDSFTFY